MSSKQRKFTNGYHTGYSDDHNDDNGEDVKENMKDNVVERAENIKSKWAKVKHLMTDENIDYEFLNCFIKGIIQNKMKAKEVINYLDVEEEIDYLMEWMKEIDEKLEEVKIYRVGRWSRRHKKIKLAQYKVIKMMLLRKVLKVYI